MTSSLALNFFLKGCNWYLQIKCAAHMWYIMDYGRTRAICAYLYNFCLFTFAFSLISIRTGGTGGRGWGKGDVTQEPSPRNTDTNSLLQFIMFCPIIFGPSTIPAIHIRAIHLYWQLLLFAILHWIYLFGFFMRRFLQRSQSGSNYPAF